MKRILLVAALALSACHPHVMQSNPGVESLEVLTPVKLSKKQIAVVQSGVTDSLKDPESARFGTMIAGKDSKGMITVCGYINAKNGFGGYAGSKPFMGMLVGNDKGFAVAGMGGDQYETASVNIICAKQGLAL